MPVILLERLPLPSLRTYTSISIGLFACALYYAIQVAHDRQAEAEEARQNLTQTTSNGTLNENQTIIDTGQSFREHATNVLLDETWCIWTLINMAYCCFILFGKVIQGAVFGELRVSEQQHIKDKFWNFVFYKFIFIFGVMNVQHMDEVMMWASWFSVLGFLHLLSQLCKDRFEYLSFSPTTPGWIHAKVLMLLVAIILMVGALSVFCCMIGFYYGINTFAFMFAECGILGIKCIYVMVRYAIHLWDLNHDGVWENRSLFVYWSEFTCEITSLAIDFVHHLHMLIWSNIFLSMASLVICMQLRYLFHEGQRRLKRHKNYLRVVKTMQASFKMATGDEIDQNNDDCAICWDKMESARRLPCGHLFHDSCLRSWLEQDTSCPTCRMSLSEPMEGEEGGRETGANLPGPPGVGAPIPGPHHHHQPVNHFFHFDGSRYVSWLPSFSVEVTHSTPILGNGPRPAQLQTSQLDNMARDVQSVFPNMPLNVVLEDLRLTRSVELTIENVLEGHLIAPPTFQGRTPSSNTLNNNQNEANPQAQASTSGGGDGPGTDPSLDDTLPSTAASNGDSAASTGAGDSLPILMSSNNNINFIHDESVPDLSESDSELNGDADLAASSALASGSGYRFSKSSREREEMLMERKQQLVEHARKKFQSAQNYDKNLDNSSEDGFLSSLDHHSNAVSRNELSQPSPSDLPYFTNLSDDHRTRRELAYRAAQRRITDTNI